MMNERIKELKSQCWDERPYGPPWFNSDKFAELIVRECARELDERTVFVRGIPAGTWIKNYMGIEE